MLDLQNPIVSEEENVKNFNVEDVETLDDFDFNEKYEEVKELIDEKKKVDEHDLDKKKEIDFKLFAIVWEINDAYWLWLTNNSLDLKPMDNWELQIMYWEDWVWAIHINIDKEKATKITYFGNKHEWKHKKEEIFHKK